MQPKLGIIAGGGHLPRRIIDVCRASERAYYVIGIEGHAIAEDIQDTPHSWIRIGSSGTGINILKNELVKEIVMIGDVKVPSFKNMRPDFRTAFFFAKIAVKSIFSFVGDNGLLSAAARELEKEGLKVIGVDQILEDLLVPEGVLGSVGVSDAFEADIKFGISAAHQLGERDAGQAVIVKSGAVIIEEDQSGTAEMIKRSQSTSPSGVGGILIKLKKPGQDRRMDLPSIGVGTVLQAKEAGLAGIILQAGETIVIDIGAVRAAADEHNIFIQALRLDEAP